MRISDWSSDVCSSDLLAEVLVEVEQTPVVVVVWVARLVVGRRLPAVRPDAAVTHLLEVLHGARRRGRGIGEGRRDRSSVERDLGHPVELVGHRGAGELEVRGRDVEDGAEMVPPTA